MWYNKSELVDLDLDYRRRWGEGKPYSEEDDKLAIK